MNPKTRLSRRGILKGTLAAVPIAGLVNSWHPVSASGTTLASTSGRHTHRAAGTNEQASAATVEAGTQAADIIAIAQDGMAKYHLKSLILRVTVDQLDIVTAAMGESMSGVPATTDMHFRNGAIAISYIATLLLQQVDRGVVSLDDRLSNWLPELPVSDKVTLRMLANMTAGYFDHVQDDGFIKNIYLYPFRQWTPQELIDISLSHPHVFEPGTNWDYSHTGYVILGRALERITGKPMATQMVENIFVPLGLRATRGSSTPEIPEPVQHAFTSERRETLGIDQSVPFYENSTYWNPSWTLAEGAIQTTDIYDMLTSIDAIGNGALLSPASHQEQISKGLIGFGSPLPGCATCQTLSNKLAYGLGIVISGSWLVQNPSFGGFASVASYLPSKKIAMAISATFNQDAFAADGNIKNYAQVLFGTIGAYLAPDDPPPSG